MFLSLKEATAVTIGKLCIILAPVAGAAVSYAVRKVKARKEK